MSAFAENLKALRSEANISQTALAKKLGVTQQCVSQWEQSKIEPTLSYIIAIADEFDISIDVLCGRGGKENALF